MAISVNAGEKEVKREDVGSKLEQWKAMHESDCSVATIQCRDVPTSRRWVNQCKSQQVATSRRLNIVTSQRHDVATSRHQREVCPTSLKTPRVQNSRIRKCTAKGTKIQSSSDTDHEEEPEICIVSHLWIIE